jgi:hypothetical protein
VENNLSLIPYEEVPREKVELPKRSKKEAYDDIRLGREPSVRGGEVLRSDARK